MELIFIIIILAIITVTIVSFIDSISLSEANLF